MNLLRAAVIALSLNCISGLTIYAQTQTNETWKDVKTYQTVTFLGDAISLRIGDLINIDMKYSPKGVYRTLDVLNPRNSPRLDFVGTFSCKVKSLYSQPNSKVIYAWADIEGSTQTVTLDLQEVFLNGSATLNGAKLLSKFNLYYFYLKTLDKVDDKDALTYSRAFNPIPSDYDEFATRKAITAFKSALEGLKILPLNIDTGQKFLYEISVGKYDFEKKGFQELDITNFYDFKMQLRDKVQGLRVFFRNVKAVGIIPVGESRAEEISHRYFSSSEKKLYYVYTFDYADGGIREFQKKDAGYLSTYDLFVKYAVVRRIDIFLDRERTEKLTTVYYNGDDRSVEASVGKIPKG